MLYWGMIGFFFSSYFLERIFVVFLLSVEDILTYWNKLSSLPFVLLKARRSYHVLSAPINILMHLHTVIHAYILSACTPKHTHTQTHALHLNRLMHHRTVAYVFRNGRPMEEKALPSSCISLLPKAPRFRRSSTAPPTSSTSTFSLTSAYLQLDSGWNTKVSKKYCFSLTVILNTNTPEEKY